MCLRHLEIELTPDDLKISGGRKDPEKVELGEADFVRMPPLKTLLKLRNLQTFSIISRHPDLLHRANVA